MRVGNCARIRHIGVLRAHNLIDPWQDVRHSPIHCVVRRGVVDRQHGVAAKHTFCQDALKRDTCNTLFCKLPLYSMYCVSEKSTTSLGKPGMLIFGSYMQFDAFPLQVLVGPLRSNNARLAVSD